MLFIYATGRPGKLAFDIAQTRKGVPHGARVFATCSAGSVAETFGEGTFQTMSDGDFYALQDSIRKAREMEADSRPTTQTQLLKKITHRLFGS